MLLFESLEYFFPVMASVYRVRARFVMAFSLSVAEYSGMKPYEGDDAALLTFNNNLLGIISNKNESLIRKVDITSHRSVRGKILLYLAYESREKGKSFNIPLNRQELADYICVDRTTLSSTLSTLQKEGLIKTEKAHFELYANIGEG